MDSGRLPPPSIGAPGAHKAQGSDAPRGKPSEVAALATGTLGSLRRDLLADAGAGPIRSLKSLNPKIGSSSSRSAAPTDGASLTAQDRVAETRAAMSRPVNYSKPVIGQLANRGVLRHQHAKMTGRQDRQDSAWSTALTMGALLPGLMPTLITMLNKGPGSLPRLDTKEALAKQDQASREWASSAPLPDGVDIRDTLVDASGATAPAGSSLRNQEVRRFKSIMLTIDDITDASRQEFVSKSPRGGANAAERVLGHLQDLDKEINRLLNDPAVPCSAPLRAELTRLAQRLNAERGFVQQVQVFARDHDTAGRTLEELTAYMRHGASFEQLQVANLMKVLEAVFSASYKTGSPVTPPRDVAADHEATLQSVLATMNGQPGPATTVAQPASDLMPDKKEAPAQPDAEPLNIIVTPPPESHPPRSTVSSQTQPVSVPPPPPMAGGPIE